MVPNYHFTSPGPDSLEGPLLRDVLGFQNLDDVRQRSLGADDTARVVGQHDGDLDAQDTLAHHDVSHGSLNVNSVTANTRHTDDDQSHRSQHQTQQTGDNVLSGLAGLDHVTISELLGLGTLAADLAGHADLSTLGARLHDEAQDTVARTADSKAAQQLVLQGLSLGLSVQTTGSDTLNEELNSAGLKVESASEQTSHRVPGQSSCQQTTETHLLEAKQQHAPVLDEGGQLRDALALLADDFLGSGGQDDNLGSGRRGDLHDQTGIAVLRQLAGKKLHKHRNKQSHGELLATQSCQTASEAIDGDLNYLVDFGVEDAVSDELSLLADVQSRSHFDCLNKMR